MPEAIRLYERIESVVTIDGVVKARDGAAVNANLPTGEIEVFARSVEAYGKEGDVLVCMSTSGNSRNAIRAIEQAKEMGVRTVALLGKGGGEMRDMADLAIVVPDATTSDRIQELHIKILHIAIEAVERAVFPENY